MENIPNLLKKILALSFFAAVFSVAGLSSYTYADNFTWNPSPSAANGDWTGVAVTNSQYDYAVQSSYNNKIYKSTNYGRDWSPSSIDSSERALLPTDVAASSFDGKYVLVSTSNYGLFKSDAYGQTWSNVSNIGMSHVTMSQDGAYMFATQDGGYVYRSADFGNTWNPINGSQNFGVWSSISCSADCIHIYAVSSSGTMYYSSDSGSTWNYTYLGYNISSLKTNADGSIVFAIQGNGGIMLKSTDYGMDFVMVQSAMGSATWASGLSVSSDGMTIVATTQDDIVYTSKDGGVTWTQDTRYIDLHGVPITNIAISPDGTRTIFASSNGYLEYGLDMTAPLINSITTDKPSGSYKAGDQITFTVNFSEPVTSSNENGINIYSKTDPSTISSGMSSCSGLYYATSTITCVYTIGSNENLTAPIEAMLRLNGSVNDLTGNQLSGSGNVNPIINIDDPSLVDPKTISIDTTAPAAPGIPTLLPADDSGISNADNITNVNKPRFTVSCNDDGETVILYNYLVVIGNGICSNSVATIQATQNGDGITALDDGVYPGINSVEVDRAGNASTPSNYSAPVTISTQNQYRTDIIAPNPVTLGNSQDSGISNSDGVTNISDPANFILQEDPGSSGGNCFNNEYLYTYVSYNGTPIGFVAASCYGGNYLTYSISSLPWFASQGGVIPEGDYTITVMYADSAGNGSAISTPTDIYVDRTAPTVTRAPYMDPSSDNGASSTDNITSDTNQIYWAHCDSGSSDYIGFYVDGVPSGSSVPCESSTNLASTTITISDLGSHIIKYKEEDLAGNISGFSPGLNMTLVSPFAPETAPSGLLMNSADDSGSTTDQIISTNVTSPRFEVSCIDGDSVYLEDSGLIYASSVCSSTAAELQPIGLADGIYNFYAIQKNNLTASSTNSNTVSVTIDTAVPASVTSFVASSTGSDVGLTWVNPINADFDSVMIRRALNPPALITDGVSVGGWFSGTSFTDTSVPNGTYYYGVFAKDTSGNIATSTYTIVTVDAPVTYPTVTGATVNGNKLIVTFDTSIATNSPSLYNYLIHVDTGGEYPQAADPVVEGNTVTLTLNRTITSTATTTFDYVNTYDPHTKNLAGNDLQPITGVAVTNITPAPQAPSSGGLSSTQTVSAGGGYVSTVNQVYTSSSYIAPKLNIGTSTQITISATTTRNGLTEILNSSTPVLNSPSIPQTGLLSQKQFFLNPNGTPFTFTKMLTVGTTLTGQDTDIKKLQVFLNSTGYTVASKGPGSVGNETNTFGSATKAALLKLQKAADIKGANGVFGPQTRKLINQLLQSINR